MRLVLALLVSLAALGCSNACPAPVVCGAPHPDYCPCLLPDAGPRPDAFVEMPDAFDTPDSGAADAAAIDASMLDATATDANADAH